MQKINQQTVITISIVSLLSLIVFFLILFTQSTQKIAYVDNTKLFENFRMTKEMKRIGEKEFNTRKIGLDSLYSKLQSQTLSEIDKKMLMQQFINGREELERFNQNFTSEESSKIWSRINSYAKEFSKINKYQLVVASGNNTVLYADEEIDITNELLIFINKKYEGI